ncbi:MAG TPA: TlpA disulfide reductase family protein [Chitinophagaceae bacterium]
MLLKLIFTTSVYLCVCSTAFAKNKFLLSGKLPLGYENVEIKLIFDNPSISPIISKAKQSKFSISGEIDEKYEHITLLVINDGKTIAWKDFFIKSDKMQIEILGFQDQELRNQILYTNIPFVEEQKIYEDLMKKNKDSVVKSFDLMMKVERGYTKGLNLDSLRMVVRNLKEKATTKRIEFIRTISNTYFGLYLFNRDILNKITYSYMMSPDSLMAIYNVFDETQKQTKLGKSINEYLKKRQSLSIGNILPDFSFVTDRGENLALSNFRDKKFVLLCFWDAGCLPCIKNFPLLIKLAKDHEDKELQLLSVSIDSNETQWQKALRKYNLPWLQTCDLPDYVKDAKIRSLYNVNYIPQYFLLDKEGRLIYHNTQVNDDEEYTMLQEKLAQVLY